MLISNMTKLFLRDWRTHRGLTQAALAERSGVHVITISATERGRYTNLRLATLEKLARALRVQVPDLFFEPPAGRGAKAAGKAKRSAGWTRARGRA